MQIPFHKIKTADLNLIDVPIVEEIDDYEGFDCSFLDMDALFEKNSFLKWLNEKFPYRAAILNVKPWRHFIWHKDSRRGVTINALLSEDRSFTLFSEDVFETSHQCDIIKLPYIKNKMFLFNAQVPHSIINFNKPRQLFSVEFEKTIQDGLTYNDLFKIIKEEYYKQ